jgi:Protein of unknown function (DUF1553)/Protein of unknown function (DUF1549)/Planctomycete cytochrome C
MVSSTHRRSAFPSRLGDPMRMIVALGVALVAGPAVGDDSFASRVRPILATHCFKCHGPDNKARMAEMRLDIRAEAMKFSRTARRPIVPGKPEQSELIARIFSKDADLMPPPHAKLALSDEQKQILKKWIADGAEYRQHWAFVPPTQAPLPEVSNKQWPRNPIDAFILARLEKEGLAPNPPADPYALIRRVYYDLIGLPPTPEEADAFTKDFAARGLAAYEALVDRLLSSPQYGERWARKWLDLARYADTNGYEKDRQRSIWPYRDWVIDALNRDMPFDQFTIEQLGGDMLPNATQSQRIATGFHRNTMLNEEGGIDPLEFRFHAMTDRVSTTATIWLGLTMGCAQCHTHKYDPISQREYYQFMAFMNNADEPEMEVERADLKTKRQQIEVKIKALEDALLKKLPPDEFQKKFSAWLQAEREKTNRWTILRPIEAKANLPLLTIEKDDCIFASGDQTKSDTYTLRFKTDLKGITGIRIEALPDERLPKHGPGRTYYEGPIGDFTLTDFSILTGSGKLTISTAMQSFAAGGGFTAAAAIDDNKQTGWSISGGQGKPHSAAFKLVEPMTSGEFTIQMVFERHYSSGLGRFRVAVMTDPRMFPLRTLTTDAEALILTEKPTPEQEQCLRQVFVESSPDFAKDRAEIGNLRKQIPAYPTTLVMQERPRENPRPTSMHNRGEFLQPTERVDAATLSALHAFPRELPRDRLGFARWLASPENPLVGRVTMNRTWAAFFGQGIVKTQQDFGFQGELPTHPELLDWLAVEFARKGWSMKKMHKLIVMSASYQQSSSVSVEKLTRDSDNRLLSRGPRIRLEAEMIRDGALRISGLLSSKMNGPSVFPPQPPGVSTEGAYGRLEWKVSEGEERYRRGLYTFTKRTTPYAMFATFDGPSGEFCTAKREVTNTPLQALTLLNDAVMIEAAQTLGKQWSMNKGPDAERIDLLFQRILIRPASADERQLLATFLERQRKRLEQKELDASAIAGQSADDVNERAAWTLLARALFNLDEAICR